MNSIQDIWSGIMEILSRDLTSTSLRTWFDDCELVDVRDGTLLVHSQNPIKRKVLKENFEAKIKAALQEMFSCDFDLQILGTEELSDLRDGQKNKGADQALPKMDGYTFDDFVVGKSNEFAYLAAQHVVKNPGNRVFNPLFIYGNSGLGKTHLLRAIGTAVHEKTPNAKIVLTKGEEFTNQLIRSIKEGKTQEFRNKFRTVDILLMDDIQFIAGKDATQEEFFCTFDSIYEAGHQIVIASDRPPTDMPFLDERLRTRFVGGLTADIQPPDPDTRMAIIRNKAEHHGIRLTDDLVAFIAEKATQNVRQIEGVINRIAAMHDLTGGEINSESVEMAVHDVIRDIAYAPSPEEIIKEVSRYYQTPIEEIKGINRQKIVAMARHVSAYLISILTGLPESEIGASINRDRSTAHASVQKIAKLIKTDKKLADAIVYCLHSWYQPRRR